MAGYLKVDEGSGEVYRVMYEYPFVVRGVPRKRGYWDNPEHESVAAFRSKAEADAWLAKWEAEYKKGPNGYASLHVENWNED